TRYAQIVALMEQASTGKPRIAQLADRLAKPFLIFVLLAAGLACAWWWPTDPARALMITVAILVITCPCALSLATPAAMLASAGALARDGVLVRRLQALEELAEVDTVVFDKTGTLTRDAFVLADVRVREGASRAQVLALAAELARGSLHPVSRALVAAAEAEAAACPGASLSQVRELAGQGVQARLVTAEGGETTLRLGSAAFCGLPESPVDGPASHLADDQGWLASFEFREDVRDDARAAIDALHAGGLRVRLLSGDRSQAAARVGALAGIDDTRGDCSPADKLAALQRAQQDGQRVAMVGDGLNDGPVLAGANVSFAFGRAVPLARAQSDFVVLGDRLLLVAKTQRQARRTMRIVRQNLAWAAAYNAIGVPLAMMGWVQAWLAGLGMAASSLLVVLNALRLSSGARAVSEEP
ncbi:MAG TPA: heavy metal translocating P-type ATPase, partial [Ottowia sp.]|uniref:heavy metal translocating P-type ATPase n=2 Tax=Ottowia sp. TaxID=1898956 RepID=UPI002BC98BC1